MPSDTKKEAGAIVHLVEELSDARLRLDQLSAYTAEAIRLIESSPHKDHFFEVAGHLIHAVPQTLLKVQKSVEAAAFAANRIDYEDLKNGLKPEKVQQLDQGLEDVRIRQIHRRSEPVMPITPKYVAEKLRQFASQTREGSLPEADIFRFISELEGGKKQASEPKVPLADMLDRFAKVADRGNKDYQRLADVLRRMVGDNHVRMAASKTAVELNDFDKYADSVGKLQAEMADRVGNRLADALDQFHRRRGDEGADSWTSGTPRESGSGWEVRVWNQGMVEQMEGVELNLLLSVGFEDNTVSLKMTEGNRGVLLKTNVPASKASISNIYLMFYDAWEKAVKRTRTARFNIEAWKTDEAKAASDDEDKQSRFEEGKPADPTQNMSPEDKKKWHAEKERNKDKFKDATQELKPKFDPSYQQQLSLMMKNPPRVSGNTVEMFSPFMKKYIIMAEYASADAAQANLGVWTKAHRESIKALREAVKSDKSASDDEDKQSRFEEGKPADPTKNMSPEDKKKWHAEKERNKDKFKAAAEVWKAEGAKSASLLEGPWESNPEWVAGANEAAQRWQEALKPEPAPKAASFSWKVDSAK